MTAQSDHAPAYTRRQTDRRTDADGDGRNRRTEGGWQMDGEHESVLSQSVRSALFVLCVCMDEWMDGWMMDGSDCPDSDSVPSATRFPRAREIFSSPRTMGGDRGAATRAPARRGSPSPRLAGRPVGPGPGPRTGPTHPIAAIVPRRLGTILPTWGGGGLEANAAVGGRTRSECPRRRLFRAEATSLLQGRRPAPAR